MFIEVPLFLETSPALKNSWLRAWWSTNWLVRTQLSSAYLFFIYFVFFKNKANIELRNSLEFKVWIEKKNKQTKKTRDY